MSVCEREREKRGRGEGEHRRPVELYKMRYEDVENRGKDPLSPNSAELNMTDSGKQTTSASVTNQLHPKCQLRFSDCP
jgi:hypothetical protein